MKFFRKTTAEKIVVMGENTLLSLPGGQPLKNRVNVVLCPEEHEYEDCICIHDFKKLVSFIKIMSKLFDIYIIGGAMLYKSMLPYYDEVLVTKVDAVDPDTTAFFPNLDANEKFYCESESDVIIDEGFKIKFTKYKQFKN